MKDFLTVLGLVLILEGLPYFAFPGAFKTWMMRMLELPESRLRIYGLISMLIGLFLIYLVRRSGWLPG
jgi:uncharacterized protein